MLSKSLFALTVAAACVLAQSPTKSSAAAEPSTSLPAGITPCILSCVTSAAGAIGCNFSDTTCVCASTQFQAQALQCLQANCTAQELQAALGLQAQECGATGATPSGPSGSVTGSATTEAAPSSSAVASVSTPVSVSGSSGVPLSSGVKPTSTAPVSSHSATGSSGTATTSATPQTSSNAAMGKGDGLGLFGFVVVSFFGLLL